METDKENKIPTTVYESDDPEDMFRHKLIEELHEINLSLRRLSERDVEKEEKQTYKDFYFSKSE